MSFLLVCVFALVLLVTCILFAFFGKKWNLNPLIALGTGALLSISFLDFLPHSFEGAYSFELVSFVVLGGIFVQIVADVYLLPRLGFLDKWLKLEDSPSSHRHSHTLSSGSVCSVAGCLTLCSFFDGIRLFSAFNMETFVAWSVMFALFFHLLSEGVLLAVFSLSSGLKKRALFVFIFCLMGSLVLGAGLAQVLLTSFEGQVLFAFSSGILIYICFIHLLPFCIRPKNRMWFFIGLAVFSLFHLIA